MDSNGKKCCDRCAAPYVPGGLSCWDENCGCHRGVCVMTAYAEPWCRGRCAEPKNCTATPEPDTPPGGVVPRRTHKQHHDNTGRDDAHIERRTRRTRSHRTGVVPSSYPSSYPLPSRPVRPPGCGGHRVATLRGCHHRP
jgi:hypothetical protein